MNLPKPVHEISDTSPETLLRTHQSCNDAALYADVAGSTMCYVIRDKKKLKDSFWRYADTQGDGHGGGGEGTFESTHVHTHRHTTRTLTHTHTRTRAHTHTHKHTHTHTHKQSHTYTFTCTHLLKYIHTHSRNSFDTRKSFGSLAKKDGRREEND